MPEGWATHYPAVIGARLPELEPELEVGRELGGSASYQAPWEVDSDAGSESGSELAKGLSVAAEPGSLAQLQSEVSQESAPPLSPRLGMPPDADAPLPSGSSSSSSPAAGAPDGDLMAGVSIGGGGASESADGGDVGEQDEHYAELFLMARKGAQTTCANMFKSWKEGNDLRVTVTDFCEEMNAGARGSTACTIDLQRSPCQHQGTNLAAPAEQAEAEVAGWELRACQRRRRRICSRS